MGNELVACVRQIPDLSPRARLALVGMAQLAKDKEREPVYWGGWEYLAGWLGFNEPTLTAQRAVTRAIRELTDAKVVTAGNLPTPGQRVTYRLHLRNGWR